MKRIVFLCGFFPYQSGGAEYQAYELAKKCREKCEVHFVSITTDDFSRNENGFFIHGLKKNEFWRRFGDSFILFSRKVIHLLDEIKPDVIYHRSASGLTGVVATYAKKNGIPMIWNLAHQKEVEPLPIRFFSRYVLFDLVNRHYQKKAINNCKLIIAQAKYQDTLLYQNFGRHADRINGNYHPAPEGENNPVNRKKQVLWVANVKHVKQAHIFVELARRFQSKDDVVFIMFGRKTDTLCHEANLHNLEGRGECPQSEINKTMQQSWCFVNTSLNEGFPNTFIQAWQRYLPVLSLVVNPDEILTQEGIGFLCGTLDQMCEDLTKLLDNQELRNEMGHRAYQYALLNHSLNNISIIMSDMGIAND